MRDHLINSVLKKIFVGIVLIVYCCFTYAIEIDTFNIPQYKILNHQLKKCLTQIAIEEGDKLHQNVGLVVVNYSQDNQEYILVGCHTEIWLQFYKMLYEVMDNDFVGCSYLTDTPCFLFGKEITKYLSDSIGMACLVDSNRFFKPLLGNEADFSSWFYDYSQNDIHVDPPVWIFKRQKRKFVRIFDEDYNYTSLVISKLGQQ